MSALEPDLIHTDFTLQSTSYETGSIHFDLVCTTNLTHCNCGQGSLFVHVIGCVSFNKSCNSADKLFGCFFIRCYVFTRKKTRKSFGAGTLDHKESRKKMEVTSISEKVAKVTVVVSINTRSVRHKQCICLFHTPRTARHFYNCVLRTKWIVTW